MSTSTTVPVQPTTTPAAQSEARRSLSGLWPLAAAGAGVTSAVFTMFTSRFMTDAETEGGVAAVYAAVDGDGTRTHLGVVAAFLCVGFLAVFAAGNAVGLTVSGRLSDRVGRRPFIVGGLVISGLATIVTGFASNLPVLVVLSVVAGVGAGMLNPAQQAALADIV